MKSDETTSLYVAVILLARGVPLLGACPGNLVTLSCDDTDGEATALVKARRAGQAMVNGRQFVTALIDVRRLIAQTREAA
jgi:hypothetical protein